MTQVKDPAYPSKKDAEKERFAILPSSVLVIQHP